MVFGMVKRLIGLLALLLLLYVFTTVPIGRRTGWEHLVAICSTEPAREAASDLRDIAVTTLGKLTHPTLPQDRGAADPSSTPSSSPSQDAPQRGKTPTPGVNHVRSAHQGVPSSP